MWSSLNKKAGEPSSRIFFLCPDDNSNIGGIKKIYQHVDILNRHGYAAYVVHTRNGFRCTWFDNNTPIAYPCWPLKMKFHQFRIKLKHLFRNEPINHPRHPKGLPLKFQGRLLPPIHPHDIIVLPEYIAQETVSSLGDQRYVIFNQGFSLTFNSQKLPKNPFQGDFSLTSLKPYRSAAF